MSIWTTKDGREIEVSDMEDSHLLNTIKFIKRRLKEINKQCIPFPIMFDEISEIDSYINFSSFHKLENFREEMITEAKERGIK